MSPQEMLKAGQWENARRAVERMTWREKLQPENQMILAIALREQSMAEGNIVGVQSAYTILSDLQKLVGTPAEYELAVTKLCLNQILDGLSSLERIAAKDPNYENIQYWIAYGQRSLAMPYFQTTAYQKAAFGWLTFQKKASELRGYMLSYINNGNGLSAQNVISMLQSHGSDVLNSSLHLKLRPLGNGQILELIYSVQKRYINIFLLQNVIRQVPAVLYSQWRFSAGVPPLEDKSTDQYRCTVEKSDNSTVRVVLYGNPGKPMDQSDLETVLGTVISELAIWLQVSSVRLVSQKKPKWNTKQTPIPLRDLPTAMEKLGVAPYKDCNDVIRRNWTVSDVAPEPDLWNRRDVTWQRTCFPHILEEYRDGRTDIMNELHRNGAVAGFLYYPICVQS